MTGCEFWKATAVKGKNVRAVDPAKKPANCLGPQETTTTEDIDLGDIIVIAVAPYSREHV
jgi:hypothetical protein